MAGEFGLSGGVSPDVDFDNLEISFSCASGEPVECVTPDGRAYMQRLIMTPEAFDLSRLLGGASVLVNHDEGKVVGKVVNAWFQGGRLCVRSRFRKNDELSVSTFRDMADGTLPNVSIRGVILKIEFVQEGDTLYGNVLSWMPVEVSVGVGIPADATVGVNRSMSNTVRREQTMADEKSKTEETPEEKIARLEKENAELKKNLDEGGGDPPPAEGDEGGGDAGNKEEIESIARNFNVPRGVIDSAIRRGLAAADFFAEVRRSLVTPGARGIKVVEKPSIVRAFQSLVNPSINAKIERGVSDDLYRSLGRESDGRSMMITFNGSDPFLKDFVRRDFNAGTEGGGADLIGTDHRPDMFIDILRLRLGIKNVSVISGLRGNVSIPRQITASEVLEKTLNQAADGTNPEIDSITLSPRKFTAKVRVGKDLLAQGNPAAVNLVIKDLLAGLALKVDKDHFAQLNATTGIGTVTIADVANATWQDMLKFGAAIMDYNTSGPLNWIMKGSDMQNFKGISKDAGSGRYLCEEDKIDGYRVDIAGHLSAGDIFLGDWSNIIMGQWGGIEVMVDPYFYCDSGEIRIVVTLLADSKIRQPQCFVKRVAA